MGNGRETTVGEVMPVADEFAVAEAAAAAAPIAILDWTEAGGESSFWDTEPKIDGAACKAELPPPDTGNGCACA